MAIQPPRLTVLTSPGWQDYELLDSGRGQKLERYGPYRFVRPEPEAVWRPALNERAWTQVDAVFEPSAEENGGHWKKLRTLPEHWIMAYKGMRFTARLSASRHVGVFPEQASQWDWIDAQVTQAKRPLKVLNLFGYTGIASLAAARAGADVTHVDASRKVITWARENQTYSGLEAASLRWIMDDALKFVQREVRRGAHYDGFILDPPKFGRGPKGEVWEFYKLIPNLLETCRTLFSASPAFLVLTAYAVKASALTLHQALGEMTAGLGGQCEAGEVTLAETSGGRLLPLAIFARWSAVQGKEK